ncbi:TPA: DUF4386 domain-containing protein [Methanosarcina acetivorans]|uniref:DUF4386 domain-containing protein n=2 Tax=Methanosarcina acetivorans TaxID=2214 RepID=Q8TNE9_METAC|nr:DUF4386 domain-containing protein [Methanosarcina acetivorans]AAM05729.1 conserved hypothetical protein [Methanosarcina acetivorans C2A]HIH95267.1 DUF4386 domain-containing protein [Methanosarcina acetivorans]
MANHTADISLRQAAIVAGFGYLIIFLLGIIANFFVLQNLIVPEDAAATVNNIMANEWQFRLGILGFIIMVIFDVVVAWALYVLLKPVNRSLSLLAAWFRLVNATIFGIALYNLFSVLQLLGDANYLAVFEISQLQTQVMLFLSAFNYTWLIGLIFFGFHLFVLGYLILRSGCIPGILGVLLMIASLGYLIDSFANFLLPDYADYETIFMLIVVVPGVIGELSLTLWLLLKGAKLPERMTEQV